MLSADARTGRADLAGGALELCVGTLAGATLADAPAVTDLLVGCQAGGGVHGAVTGTASVVGVTYTDPALALSMSW